MQKISNTLAQFPASFCLVLGLCMLDLAGCNKETATAGAPKAGTIGIVDLDEVSKAVGWTSEVKSDQDAAVQDVKSQWQVFASSAQNALAAKRKAIGEAAHLSPEQLVIFNANQLNAEDFQKLPLSKEQKEDFLRSNAEVAQAIKVATQQADQALQQHNAQVIQSLREAMTPAVRRVAVAAGVTTVLPSNIVFYYDPSVNLSNQVVDDLHKAMPPHAFPPMQKMNYPDFHFTTAAPAAVSAP